MDERRLTELFRDAVCDAPPASFDVRDVTEASRRATRRQRAAVLVGSAMGVAVLFGGAAMFTDLLGSSTSGSTVAGPQTGPGDPLGTGGRQERVAPVSPFQQPDGPGTAGEPSGGAPATSFPGGPPMQGGGTSGEAGPGTGSTQDGCGPADRELADALAGELPAAAGRSPVPLGVECPVGARGVRVPVQDGTATGDITVVLGPEGSGASGAGEVNRPDGARGFAAVTPSGRLLTVTSESTSGTTPPFADRVGELAQRLAERF
ncbi:MAG TPA: hypothetical protein VIL00_15650 [Pseudonocardiaceae bacterium]